MLQKNIINIILSRQLKSGAFSYQNHDRQGSGEATCWASLVLLHHSKATSKIPLKWLENLQNSNGSVNISNLTGDIPIWLTSLYAIVMKHANKNKQGKKAIDFLLKFEPKTYANQIEVKQDNSLKGASWTKDTFSWVEPTAWMLLAIKCFKLTNHPRSNEAIALLLDRYIPEKGWNYGNRNVYSSDLLPFYDITALTLMALHGITDTSIFAKLILNLSNEILISHSPYSLILGILCLNKYSIDPSKLINKLKFILNDSSLINYCNTVHLSMAYIALSDWEVL